MSVVSFHGTAIFDNAEKSTIDLVAEVCNYLKYESLFHKIHLTETGNSFLSLF